MIKYENIFDLRKFEEWHVKELLLSLYEGLKGGESITLVNSENLDWLNKEISGVEIKSDKTGENEWTAKLVKNEKKECCGMCGHN